MKMDNLKNITLSLSEIRDIIEKDDVRSIIEDAKDTFSQTFNSNTVKKIKSLAYEIISAVTQQILPVAAASAFLAELLHEFNEKTKIGSFFEATLIDLIWLFDVQLTDNGSLINVSTNPDENQERMQLLLLCKELLEKNVLSDILLKERLETDFLENLGLIHSAQLFNKKMIRVNTSLLYKQQKFNLLREESEGYSKLTTEILANMGPGVFEVSHEELEIDLSKRIPIVLNSIGSLIGYFDLDPNRVLDVILDIFCSNVTKHHSFFLKLIESSPWYTRKAHSSTCQDNSMDDSCSMESTLTKKPHWVVKIVESIDSSGSSVIGQILGFKFSYYNQPDSTEHAPEALFMVTALLLRHGMVNIRDIYPHLSPNDDIIEKDYAEYSQNLESRAKKSKSLNLLAQMPPLEEGAIATPVPVAAPEPDKEPPSKKYIYQKGSLAYSTLAVGDLPHALFILARLPNLCSLQSSIVDALMRILHEMIEPLYENLRPSTRFPVPSHGSSKSKFIPTLSIKQFSPRSLYKFFYNSWQTELPTVQSLKDFVSQILPLLRYVGVHLYQDVVLLGKLIRIGKSYMNRDAAGSEIETSVKNAWLNITSEFFLPAISKTTANPGIIMELWSLIKQFNYQERYTLYGEWKNNTYNRFPELISIHCDAARDTKMIMRRLSKDNIKQIGRWLAKVSHANPTITFKVILDQIQAYDNLVIPVVDACKYITGLGFDVLSYIILESLSNTDKERMKADGTNISQWLQNLALFCGTLFRKYPSMELTGLLQYVVNQLKDENSLDLIILKELVEKMAGIEGLEGASEAQIEAMAGGDTLRNEALSLSQVRVTKRSSARLTQALILSKLAAPLCILIAQQRENCIFRSNITHLKLLGNLFDQCQETLVQYVEFLSTYLEKTAYARLIPTLSQMCGSFCLEPELAFYILRPKLNFLLSNSSTSVTTDSNNETKDSSMETDEKTISKESNFWHPSLADTIAQAKEALPASAWKGISPEFYVSFWQLSLYDIYIPKDRYNSEIARQREVINQLDSNADNQMTPAKKKKEKERAVVLIDKLEKEMSSQENHVKQIVERLKKEKNFWFSHSSRYDVVSCFIQYCIFPRCLFTAMDSIFCAKFIDLLHQLGTVNFSTLTLYDKLANDISSTIFCCTEYEASHYGRFLNEFLSLVARWHSSPELYKEEAIGKGLIGFQKKWHGGSVDVVVPEEDLLHHEDFKHVAYKWHIKLHRAFIACLESKEYMQTRNAIMILTKIEKYFPCLRRIGLSLDRNVSKIVESEQREDLKVMALRYQAILKSKKAGWLPAEEYHDMKSTTLSKKVENTRQDSLKEPSNQDKHDSSAMNSHPASPMSVTSGKFQRESLRTSQQDRSIADNQEKKINSTELNDSLSSSLRGEPEINQSSRNATPSPLKKEEENERKISQQKRNETINDDTKSPSSISRRSTVESDNSTPGSRTIPTRREGGAKSESEIRTPLSRKDERSPRGSKIIEINKSTEIRMDREDKFTRELIRDPPLKDRKRDIDHRKDTPREREIIRPDQGRDRRNLRDREREHDRDERKRREPEREKETNERDSKRRKGDTELVGRSNDRTIDNDYLKKRVATFEQGAASSSQSPVMDNESDTSRKRVRTSRVVGSSKIQNALTVSGALRDDRATKDKDPIKDRERDNRRRVDNSDKMDSRRDERKDRPRGGGGGRRH